MSENFLKILSWQVRPYTGKFISAEVTGGLSCWRDTVWHKLKKAEQWQAKLPLDQAAEEQ